MTFLPFVARGTVKPLGSVAWYMSEYPRDGGGRFAEKVSERDILDLFAEADAPFLTAPEIAARVGVTRQAITYRLKRMQEKGLVDRKDVGSNAVVWWVPDEEGSRAASYLSWKAIDERYGDDRFGQNPGWAEGLEDLGENA